MAENGQPIIVKKVKKGGGHGHHGGSWKVAYADFVTAMMAFFLLLWLLNASNKAIRDGISSYFKNPSMVMSDGGHSTSVIELGSNVDVSKGDDTQARQSDNNENSDPSTEEYKQIEMAQLRSVKEDLEYIVDTSPEISPFRDQLIMDITEEGLVIQIVDKDKRPMFDLGSAQLKSYARKILREFAPVLNQVSNKLSMSGHTDAKKYFRADGYSNWELSADRANAARRELINAGLPSEKISRVVGMASKVPYLQDDPTNPMNRRISITVLNRQAEQEIYKESNMSSGSLPPPSYTPKQFQEAVKAGQIQRSGAIIRN